MGEKLLPGFNKNIIRLIRNEIVNDVVKDLVSVQPMQPWLGSAFGIQNKLLENHKKVVAQAKTERSAEKRRRRRMEKAVEEAKANGWVQVHDGR